MSGVAVLVGEARARRGDPVEVGEDQVERPARDEHRGGVRDVLARRALVDVAGRVFRDARDVGSQRPHEGTDGVAGGAVPRVRSPPGRRGRRRSGRRWLRRRRPGSGRPAPPRAASAASASSIACSHALPPTASRIVSGTKIGPNRSSDTGPPTAGAFRVTHRRTRSARSPCRRMSKPRAPSPGRGRSRLERAAGSSTEFSTGSAALASSSSGK